MTKTLKNQAQTFRGGINVSPIPPQLKKPPKPDTENTEEKNHTPDPKSEKTKD